MFFTSCKAYWVTLFMKCTVKTKLPCLKLPCLHYDNFNNVAWGPGADSLCHCRACCIQEEHMPSGLEYSWPNRNTPKPSGLPACYDLRSEVQTIKAALPLLIVFVGSVTLDTGFCHFLLKFSCLQSDWCVFTREMTKGSNFVKRWSLKFVNVVVNVLRWWPTFHRASDS